MLEVDLPTCLSGWVSYLGSCAKEREWLVSISCWSFAILSSISGK
jgi:hypothetical protein